VMHGAGLLLEPGDDGVGEGSAVQACVTGLAEEQGEGGLG
jgi:hypothetical protein